MKKKVILVILLCCSFLILISCNYFNKDNNCDTQDTSSFKKDSTDVDLSPQNTKEPTENNSASLINEYNENCVLPLGVSRDKVKLKLKELNIEIINEYEGKDDNDNPNGLWFIYTDDLELDFNTKDQLSQVFVNSTLSTSAGLKFGDSLQKMYDIYGDECSYDSGWGMYIYKMKNCNFGVIYNLGNENNAVDSWTIFQVD